VATEGGGEGETIGIHSDIHMELIHSAIYSSQSALKR
jgi:hypothetical protein